METDKSNINFDKDGVDGLYAYPDAFIWKFHYEFKRFSNEEALKFREFLLVTGVKELIDKGLFNWGDLQKCRHLDTREATKLVEIYNENRGAWKSIGSPKLSDLVFEGKNGYRVATKEEAREIAENPSLSFEFTLTHDVRYKYYESIALDLIQNVKNELGNGFREIAFKKIKSAHEINEKNLSLIIDELEKQKNSIAYLSYGFLLEGRIITLVDEKKSAAYMEKRLHDAITFYIKAAEDIKIKPLVDHILWELKTVSNTYSSVQKRLSEFDVTPGFVKHYNLYQKGRDGIVAPLYRSLGLFSKPSEQKNNAAQIETICMNHRY